MLFQPKGKAIQVEDSTCERQPSVDVRHPVERDSNVIIQVARYFSTSGKYTGLFCCLLYLVVQIPVQDMEEELSSSVKVAFDRGSSHVDEAFDDGQSGDIGSDDGDMLCFSSASEDELPILERPTEEKGTSIPERSALFK